MYKASTQKENISIYRYEKIERYICVVEHKSVECRFKDVISRCFIQYHHYYSLLTIELFLLLLSSIENIY